MQSCRLLLSGLVITGCVGLLAGCSTSTAKKSAARVSASSQPASKSETEYVVKHAARQSPDKADLPKALPLKQYAQQAKSSSYSAAKERQTRLRLQRQKEWQLQQEQEQKRAEYRKRYQEKQQQAQQQQAQQIQQQSAQLAQQQQAAKRQKYQQQWQQQQAKRQQYQQQWQQKQQQAKASQRNNRQYAQQAQPRKASHAGRGSAPYSANQLSGDFAGNPALLRFIDRVSRRHGFSKTYLYGVFSRTRNRDTVARLWAGNGGGSGSGRGWYNYRSKFVTPGNITKGAQFWNQYRPHLLRASQRYNVDPEYIVGIMGVETRWGRILGKHKVIDALTTSAIVNKRRSKFFFKELENYLLMTRSERMDPLIPKGSYAGAMGYGQFMPSSFRAFAVDFDGDGVRDLWNPVDAIGSVANYFAKHGWKRGQEVVVPAKVTSMAYTGMPDGYKVKYSASRLAKKGIRPRNGRWSKTGRTHLLALTTVPGGLKEPWIGYHNFYVITRYNHSNYYAMAVHQLAKAVQQKAGGGKYASR